jgi:mannitol-1-/sugar-/sorbitol-6-phosphatase
VPARSYELHRTGQRAEFAADEVEVDLVGARFVARLIELHAPPLRDATDEPIFAGADERRELLLGDTDALLGEHRDRGLRDERLRRDQDAVHVEDHRTQARLLPGRAHPWGHFAPHGARHVDAPYARTVAIRYVMRGIVFDLDGVLVDSMPAVRAVWSEWARHRGVDPDAVLASIHLTAEELVRSFAPELDPAMEARAVAERQMTVETAIRAFDGARDALEHLPREAWAVVTSARRELALRHLSLARLPLPDVLVCAEDTPRGKPDPAGYILAAKRMRQSSRDCLVLEDSPAGVRAARAAGMTVIAVTNTHPLNALGEAHHVIASLGTVRIEATDRGVAVTI